MSKINKIQVNSTTYDIEDISKQDIMQYSTLPTASSDNVGKIVQYIGTTSGDYTNGYYYKCLDNSGIYSWSNINIQSDDCYLLTSSGNSLTGNYLSILTECVNKYQNGKPFELQLKVNKGIMQMLSFANTVDNEFVVVFTRVYTSYDSDLKCRKVTFSTTDSAVTSATLSEEYTESLLSTTSQIIQGQKTFSSVPVCATAPTSNSDLANKKYVDDNVVQYSTMPTASSSNVGKIVQYTGTTDSTYTNGYFYICVENSSNYSWENIPVQSNSGGSDGINIELINEGYPSGEYYGTIDFRYMNKGIYLLSDHTLANAVTDSVRYKKDNDSNTYPLSTTVVVTQIYIVKTIDEIKSSSLTSDTMGYVVGYDKSGFVSSVGFANTWKLLYNKSTQVISLNSISYSSGIKYITNTSQEFQGVKTFTSIPKQSTTTAPTNDKEFTNKKYVDDNDKVILGDIASAYDSTATYAVGDYVIYNGLLYVCSTAITTAEDWTSAHWTRTTVVDILGNVNSVLATLTTPGGNS